MLAAFEGDIHKLENRGKKKMNAMKPKPTPSPSMSAQQTADSFLSAIPPMPTQKKPGRPSRELPDALNALIVEKLNKEEFGEGFDDFQEADQFDEDHNNNDNNNNRNVQSVNALDITESVNAMSNGTGLSIKGMNHKLNDITNPMTMDQDDDFGDFDAFGHDDDDGNGIQNDVVSNSKTTKTNESEADKDSKDDSFALDLGMDDFRDIASRADEERKHKIQQRRAQEEAKKLKKEKEFDKIRQRFSEETTVQIPSQFIFEFVPFC